MEKANLGQWEPEKEEGDIKHPPDKCLLSLLLKLGSFILSPSATINTIYIFIYTRTHTYIQLQQYHEESTKAVICTALK